MEANHWYIDLKDNVEKIYNVFNSQLMQYICKFFYFSSLTKLNTTIKLSLVDDSKPKLCLSPSVFITKTWLSLQKHHPDALRLHFMMLFWHNTSLRYKRQEMQIVTSNLASALRDLGKISNKLSDNLIAGCIFEILSFLAFFRFSSRLVVKSDDRF